MNLRHFWTGGSVPAASPREPADGASSARRQMVAAAVCLLILAAAAWLAIILSESRRTASSDGAWLTYQNRVYQRIDDAAALASLGVSAPTADDCGDRLAVLEQPAALKGAALHRFSRLDSDAVLAVQQGEGVHLYQFHYFTDATAHTGGDVLSVCGEGASLEALRVVTQQDGWKTAVRDLPALGEFTEQFGALTPVQQTTDIQALINRSGAWDAVVTLVYDNGLSFHLTIYKEENLIAGFRSVYPLPADLLALLRQNG